MPWLTAMIALPLIAAAAIPFIPDKDGKTVRLYALYAGLANLTLMVYGFWSHYSFGGAEMQLTETYSWIPQLGISWSVGVDGLSMPLILLSGLITTLAILASWKVDRKPRLYYFLVLVLYSAQIGVFAAQDLMLFFLMWEIELVPVYLLISIWGGEKRLYAATKFILYTALASIFILVAGLALAFYGDNVTFNLTQLAMKDYPLSLSLLAYAGFLIAFGVKLPIFPLHTWLPDAHSQASAPISMILAGVLLKMGGYALIRFNVELLPDAHIQFAPLLIILGVINIVYGAFTAFGQTNLKRRLASSSISHMGFVLIGIASFTELGLNGAMLQMLSHGLIAAALFFPGWSYLRPYSYFNDGRDGRHGKINAQNFCSIYRRSYGKFGTTRNEWLCERAYCLFGHCYQRCLRCDVQSWSHFPYRRWLNPHAYLFAFDVTSGVLWRRKFSTKFRFSTRRSTARNLYCCLPVVANYRYRSISQASHQYLRFKNCRGSIKSTGGFTRNCKRDRPQLRSFGIIFS